MTVEPYEFALAMLEFLGVDFDKVYNNRDGIRRNQLKILGKLNAVSDVKVNAYKTIHRLYASPNRDNLDFGKNLKNTLTGTIKTALMDSLEDLPKADQRRVTIKWLPSSADESDPAHALNYGKTMTLDVAIRKVLGVRYGCKCAFKVISGEDVVKRHLDRFRNKVKK